MDIQCLIFLGQNHGNSYALIIDRAVLDLLKIDSTTALDISTDGQVLIVTPVRDEKERKRFQQALDTVNQKYGRTLRRLAE